MRLVPFLVFLVLAAESKTSDVDAKGDEEFDFRSRVLHIPKGYFRIQDNALPQGEEAASTFVECLERVSKAGKCDGDMARAKAKYGAIPDKVDQACCRGTIVRKCLAGEMDSACADLEVDGAKLDSAFLTRFLEAVCVDGQLNDTAICDRIMTMYKSTRKPIWGESDSLVDPNGTAALGACFAMLVLAVALATLGCLMAPSGF